MSLLLALLIFAATAQQAEAPTTIVTRHWTQYSNWITKGDAESLANLYAPEARVMEPGLDDVIGRVAIRSLFANAFAQRVRPVDVRMMPREVVGYEGIIYDMGDYVQTVAPQANPRGAYDVYGRYFAVWVQQTDASWKIARIMQSPKKQPAAK
jgi:ketosteroid isomerase-like protein